MAVASIEKLRRSHTKKFTYIKKYGIFIEKPAEHFSTSVHTSKDSGFSSMVSQNQNRGYATGTITFFENSSMDLKKASQYLCTECINSILDECWDNTPYGIGLIDFAEKKIRLFEDCVSGYIFGDYYISCEYRTKKDHKNQDMYFLIFYCPERY